jgi:hypothetical protein
MTESSLVCAFSARIATGSATGVRAFAGLRIRALPKGLFLRGWADLRGGELYRRLELGEIAQAGWNEGSGVAEVKRR